MTLINKTLGGHDWYTRVEISPTSGALKFSKLDGLVSEALFKYFVSHVTYTYKYNDVLKCKYMKCISMSHHVILCPTEAIERLDLQEREGLFRYLLN